MAFPEITQEILKCVRKYYGYAKKARNFGNYRKNLNGFDEN